MTLARIQSYAVTCPECRGTRYLPGQQFVGKWAPEGQSGAWEVKKSGKQRPGIHFDRTQIQVLCWRCNGEGQIVIPDTVKQPINLRGPILLCLAIIVVGLVLAKVWEFFP